MEYDTDVLEYYDQPSGIKLSYQVIIDIKSLHRSYDLIPFPTLLGYGERTQAD